MLKLSAGIIAYRKNTKGDFEVLLVHPGGPFFKNKDAGVWSIPKGEYADDEDALLAARREFTEETGNILPETGYMALTPVKLKSGKIVSAWAIKANFEKPFIRSNLFEMEWPPRSGKKQCFPETDEAQWFTFKEAAYKISSGQINIIKQLETILITDKSAEV